MQTRTCTVTLINLKILFVFVLFQTLCKCIKICTLELRMRKEEAHPLFRGNGLKTFHPNRKAASSNYHLNCFS